MNEATNKEVVDALNNIADAIMRAENLAAENQSTVKQHNQYLVDQQNERMAALEDAIRRAGEESGKLAARLNCATWVVAIATCVYAAIEILNLLIGKSPS